MRFSLPLQANSLFVSHLLLFSMIFCFSYSAGLCRAPLGDYRCVGNNPGQKVPYKGHVHVEKNGQTYTLFGVLALPLISVQGSIRVMPLL